MEQPNPTNIEREKSALVQLFESGKFEEAKETADQLLQAGYPKPLICRSLYNSFGQLKQEKAKKVANIFSDYNFQCWLP